MLMRVWLYIGIVHLVIPEVISQYFPTSSSPLQPAHFEAIVEDGCSIDVLPDTIDWCDGKLTDKGKLPDNTVCQSLYADNIYLVCRYGRWITPKNGRSRRALSEAYKTKYNRTCSRFCTEDSGFYGKSVPFYSYCPASVTLYPEYNPEGNETDNGTEVDYTWETPQAADSDGNVTTLEQIVGPEPNTTLNGTFSPGTNYIISYLATDNDNINWTCSFTVRVEIPNCPPIVHIKNGYSKCNDSNFRFSACRFTCNDGYRLNGSQTTTCQENGNWSYADDVPQCIVATCDEPVFINDTSIDVFCENSTDNSTETEAQFGSLCWMQCASTYLIRNDELQADILQNLDNLRQSAKQDYDLSQYDAEAARNYSNNAADLADTLKYMAITAENNTIAVNTTLQTAIGELNDLNKTMNETQNLLAQMQLQYNLVLKNGTNSTELHAKIQDLTKNMTALNKSVQAAQDNVKNVTLQYDEAYAASVLAQKTADEAVLNANIAETVAQEKEDYITVTTALLEAAKLNFFQAFTYSTTGNNIIVSSYAICTADGVWKIPGNPYCDDMEPPGVKCLPVVTHILNSGQTSGKVTWNIPEVYDNSGSAILYNISGPVPNDTLRVGQYIAQYRSEDDEGNLSPVCTMAINVQVYICDDITSHLPKNTEATCDSFELGATCNLTSTLKGTTTVTCKRNSTTGEMFWDFGSVDTDCLTPYQPSNGNVLCVENIDNTAGKVSTKTTCTYSCDDGYVLPYKSAREYSCTDGGVWSSDDLPTRCIEAGIQQNTAYPFILHYKSQNCTTEDMEGFKKKLNTSLLAVLPDYTVCMGGYMCTVGEMVADCSPVNGVVSIKFTILVTCEGPPTNQPLEATCNLEKEGDLFNSIKYSVEVDGILNITNVTLTKNWLEAGETLHPNCSAGAIMIGAFCVRCAAGTFYSAADDMCVKCANGTFTDTDGRTNCTVCPAGSTTLDTGSTDCTALQCITPPAPANGMVDCDEDFSNTTYNSTGTTSTGVECTFTCDEGYVLPYKTESVYTCSEEGVWDSNVFPKRCIKAIGEKYAEYEFSLKYKTTNCQTADLDGFMYQWEAILIREIPDYVSCMNGYLCELGNMMANCSPSDNIVDVSFEVLVTCEGFPTSLPREAPCDLEKEVALYESIKDSVKKRDVLHSVNVSLLEDWLTNVSVSLPTCNEGSVLIGAYCVGCAAGNFYATGLDRCLECGIKAYTDTDGRAGCTTCPDGFSTFTTGSTECTATCQARHYSSTGFVPCSICRTGTYQQNEQGKNCTACPPNTWTTIEGGNSSAACVEYELYFDADAQDIYLTAVNSTVSVVFWMKYYYPTNVTIGLFNEDDDPVFQLEASKQPQFLDGWTNEPLNFTFELGTWSMFGFTYNSSSGDVIIYADGEQLLALTLNVADIADKLKISMIGNTSSISGLSVSNKLVGVTEISRMYDDCAAQLPGAFYTQDDLAAKRLPSMKYAASTCKVSNASIEADHCGIHKCQNGGRCEGTAVGYTCNCTDRYGGPFCEETLVHGNWSNWFYAAGCSATCGPGSQLAYRFCNNPPKSEYGNDCEGNSTQVVDCFLQNCTECKQPVVEGVAICELRDDHCTATCPPGYVLPRGQQKQVFQCGQTTNYNWAPFHRLPICAESRQPKSYSATMTFTFDNPVPCNIAANVSAIFHNVATNQRCINEIADCHFTLKIINCDGGPLRRKRQAQTHLVIVFTIPLISNVTFDLVKYYATSNMTDSILEALTAISVLEQTIQDILNNSTKFTAVVDGVTYTVAGNDTAVRTDTHCYVGEVPVEAVCARCQKGTHASNGWCVYCDRGSYQADAGQTRCLACPNGETTDFVGARSPNECIVLPVVPEPTDITSIIIIIVAVVLGLIVVILVVVLARRFYLSSKDREKFDMEADRISLYTDFPDLAYNVYFKRREVLGFDESGYPIIGKTRFMNGPVKHKGEGQTVERSPREPLYQDELQTPFSYDPYAMWSEETFVSPYEYPTEDTFDFPKIEHAVRYRVPGRQHLQNTYPLSQFGYTGDPHVRCRKNLPLPVNIPYPKKLPQLMHRKPEPVSFSELLKSQFGFKKLRKEDLEEGIPIDPKNIQQNGVPPLPIKKITGKKTKNKGRKMSAPAAVRLTRSAGPSPRSPRKKPRSAPVVKAGIILQTKLEDRSPRAASAFSPRSSSTDTPSPRRPATTLGRSPRVVEFDDETPHPKPSRYVVPKNVTLPNNLPFPTKSALKVSLPDDHRPETALTTGRKSVTIREDANITRPSTVATSFRPSTAGSSLQETIIELPRPFSDAGSARDSIFAPYSARPKSTFSAFSDRPHPLPTEITEAYRPVSSIFRPTTPLEHPRPVMHGAVTIKRTAGHAMFFPPTHLSFQQNPPVEHSMRQMAPPPFLNRVKPETTTVRNGPSPNRERPNLDDGNEVLSVNGSFFLTEVPEPLSASRVSLAGSVMSRGSKSSKKPSPPPDYSLSARDKIIESSSMSHFGE